jgi:hypothetical protein
MAKTKATKSKPKPVWPSNWRLNEDQGPDGVSLEDIDEPVAAHIAMQVELIADTAHAEAQFKADKDRLKAELLAYLEEHGIPKVKFNYATVSQGTHVSVSVSGTKVKEALVKAGVAADVAAEAVDAGTTRKEKPIASITMTKEWKALGQ